MANLKILYSNPEWFSVDMEIFGQIPIGEVPDDNKLPVIASVNHIHDLKKQDINSNITDLESRIDQLIYQLYDLTPEKIAMVEA